MSWWNVAIVAHLALRNGISRYQFSLTKRLPFDFCLCWRLVFSRNGVRILSFFPSTTVSLSREPKTNNETAQHPLHFPSNIFFSPFFSRFWRRKFFRCAPIRMEAEENRFFSSLERREKFLFEECWTWTKRKKYFQVNESIMHLTSQRQIVWNRCEQKGNFVSKNPDHFKIMQRPEW